MHVPMHHTKWFLGEHLQDSCLSSHTDWGFRRDMGGREGEEGQETQQEKKNPYPMK
jgi:hypothetical protein